MRWETQEQKEVKTLIKRKPGYGATPVSPKLPPMKSGGCASCGKKVVKRK